MKVRITTEQLKNSNETDSDNYERDPDMLVEEIA